MRLIARWILSFFLVSLAGTSLAASTGPWQFQGKTFFKALAEIARRARLNLIVDARDGPLQDFHAPADRPPEEVLEAIAALHQCRSFPNGEFVTIVPQRDRLRLEEENLRCWQPTWRPVEAIVAEMVPFPPRNLRAGLDRAANLLYLRGFPGVLDETVAALRPLDHPTPLIELTFAAGSPGAPGSLASGTLLTLAEAPFELILAPTGGTSLKLSGMVRPTDHGGLLLAVALQPLSGSATLPIYQNLVLPAAGKLEIAWPVDRPWLTLSFLGRALSGTPTPAPTASSTPSPAAARIPAPSQVSASASAFLDFDLVNAHLPDALEMIIASLPGETLVCQPETLEPINLFCHGPEPYPETFLNMLLRAKGLAIGKIGSTWVAGLPEDIFYRTSHVERGQHITRRLQVADAELLERAFAVLLPRLGFRSVSLVADPFLNALIMAGHRDELDDARHLVDVLDRSPDRVDLVCTLGTTPENRVEGSLPLGSTRRLAADTDAASLSAEVLPVGNGGGAPVLVRFSVTVGNLAGRLGATAWIPLEARGSTVFRGGPGAALVGLTLRGVLRPRPTPAQDSSNVPSTPSSRAGPPTPSNPGPGDAFDRAFDSGF